MAHELPVFEIFSTVHAFVAFLGSLKSEVDSPPDHYEGNRAGDGTLDILIHNSFLRGKHIIKRPEKQTEFG